MTTGRIACRMLAALALIVPVSALGAAQASAQTGGKGGGVKIVFAGGFIYHSEEIPAGATVSFKVTCPPPMTAASGTLSSGDPKVLSLLSVKSGTSAWAFGFRNTDTKSLTVVVVVTCIKPLTITPAALAAGLKKAKKKATKVTKVVPADTSDTLTSPCPKGQAPVGESEQSGGVTPKSARLAAAQNVDGAQVTSLDLGRRAVTIGVRNPGPSVGSISLQANCLPKTLSIRGRQRSIQVNRASFPETVGKNGSVVSGACPGQLPLAAGFSIPAGGQLGFLGTGFGLGSFNASWAFSNSTGQPQQARVSLACTPGKAKFAQGLPPSQTIDTLVGPITISG